MRVEIVEGQKGPEVAEIEPPTSKRVNLGDIRKGISLPAEPSAATAPELALQRLGEGVFGEPSVG